MPSLLDLGAFALRAPVPVVAEVLVRAKGWVGIE
jgi:hypothetical protein